LFDPADFELIDWDDEEDVRGNLAHCLRHEVDERVVAGVLGGAPVEISLQAVTAEFVVIGPDGEWAQLWTLLFARSYKDSRWLRPVTGWRSKSREIKEWERASGKRWKGLR